MKTITSNALSFTILLVFFSVLDIVGYDNAASVDASATLTFFLITTTVMLLMMFTNKLVENNVLLMMFVHIIEIEASVLFWGMLVFDLVPREPQYILGTLIVGVLVYIPVIAFFLIKGKTEENKINNIIKRRKKEVGNEEDN